MAEIRKPDLCIIGAGAPGTALAIAARTHGATVLVVDVGTQGDSLETGPVPGAALAAAAARAQAIRTASDFGISNGEPKPNFRAIQNHVQAVSAAIAPRETAERLAALGIEMLATPAEFIDRRTIKAGDTLIRAHRFVIATGSIPVVPDIRNLTDVPFFTTDTIFANGVKLSHLAVLGGSAAGLELAQAYRRFGCDVTVLDHGAALTRFDSELTEITLRQLREEGVRIVEHITALEIQPRSQGIGVLVRDQDGKETVLDASHVLLAMGRIPDLGALGLDKAGIRMDKTRPGQLMLRPRLLTSNRRVHAIGESAGAAPSRPSTLHDARIVLESALFGRAIKRDIGAIPKQAFTDPQIAQIGLDEAQARRHLKRGYVVIRANFAQTDRAIATRRAHGTAKLVIDRNGTIKGAAIVGPEAGEIIGLFGLAIAKDVKLAELADWIAPYPSFVGIITQLVEAWQAQAAPEPWRQRRRALMRRLP